MDSLQKIGMVEGILREWNHKRTYEASQFREKYPDDQDKWLTKLSEIDSHCLGELQRVFKEMFSNP